jgi:hypothetical protein
MDAILKELAAIFGAYALLAVVAALKTILVGNLNRERDTLSTSLRQQADAALEQIRQQGLRETVHPNLAVLGASLNSRGKQ